MPLSAQRNATGAISFGISAGTVNGIILRTKLSEWIYMFGIDCAVVTTDRNSLVFGIDHTKRQTFSFFDRTIRNTYRYTLSLGRRYPLFHDRVYNFVVGVGWSILGGYDYLNNANGSFIYGAKLTLNLTYYLNECLALIGKVAEQYTLPDKSFDTLLSVGFR